MRALLWVFLPKLIGGLHTFALNLIAVRALPPEQFGGFSFCTTLIVLIDGLLGSAVDLGVIRESPDPPARRFTAAESAGALLKAAFALVILLPALLLGREYAMSAAATGAILLLRSVQTHFQIRKQFERFGAAELIHVAVRCGVLITLLWSGEQRVWVLLTAYAAAPVAALALYPARRPFAQTGLAEAMRALLQFLRETLLATGTGTTLSRADILALRYWSTPAELGIYSAANTIAVVPELVASYLANVFSPGIVPRVQAGVFRGFFRRFHAAAIPAAALLLAASLAVLPGIIESLFPARYAPAIPALRILLPGAFASALLFPLAVSYLLFYSPRTFVRFDLAIALFLIAGYAWMIPRHGAEGAAWVTVVFRCVKAAWILAAAFRLRPAQTRSI